MYSTFSGEVFISDGPDSIYRDCDKKKMVRDRGFANTKADLNDCDLTTLPEFIQDSVIWYRELDSDNKAHLLNLLKLSIHHTIFRMLVCLDGVKPIDDKGGKLTLLYRSEDRHDPLILADDSDAEEFLHDIYNSDYPVCMDITE